MLYNYIYHLKFLKITYKIDKFSHHSIQFYFKYVIIFKILLNFDLGLIFFPFLFACDLQSDMVHYPYVGNLLCICDSRSVAPGMAWPGHVRGVYHFAIGWSMNIPTYFIGSANFISATHTPHRVVSTKTKVKCEIGSPTDDGE